MRISLLSCSVNQKWLIAQNLVSKYNFQYFCSEIINEQTNILEINFELKKMTFLEGEIKEMIPYFLILKTIKSSLQKYELDKIEEGIQKRISEYSTISEPSNEELTKYIPNFLKILKK
jgi:hypothetical protein